MDGLGRERALCQRCVREMGAELWEGRRLRARLRANSVIARHDNDLQDDPERLDIRKEMRRKP